ncbi:PfkB family carbohydrate kinase [soil metagenome]
MSRSHPADSPRVVVIGGANVDVLARPHRPPVPATSNPGEVTVTAGGVGRNIAETLARLGTSVALVAVVGSDAHGDLVLEVTGDAGVDVDLVRRGLTPTGTYVALLDEAGELVSAVADMAATASLSPTDVGLARSAIASADLVVIDGNLATAALVAAWEAAVEAGVDVVLDPVSVPKAAAIGQLLGVDRPLAVLSAGAPELAALVTGGAEALERGVAVLWERSGPAGSVLRTTATTTQLVALPATVEDVTGAGDAMLAAYCHAVLQGETAVDAARYGHAAAALTVASRHSVRPDLSDALVRSLL